MEIRLATLDDLPLMLGLFAKARAFMAASGNPYQWGHNQWPPKDVLEQDIRSGRSHLIVDKGEVLGTFYLRVGERAEPCYDHVYDGSFVYDGPYAVIHRIASSFARKGVLSLAVNYALTLAPHVRIDTYKDNTPMLSALSKKGFLYRGVIYVEHDEEPRLAFEI